MLFIRKGLGGRFFLASGLLLLVVGVSAFVPPLGEADVRDSMVKIYTVRDSPDYDTPWSTQGPEALSGSGCLIGDNRILTNAHVVSYGTYIQVRRHGSPDRVPARVLAVSHQADLALLAVEEPGFFEGAAPLAFGGLPETQDEVLVYGFPEGGDTLSLTKGVVSRIEHQNYVHSSHSILAGQIDAAINPGNSGGPVMIGDRIVGIVMQGRKDAQNIGYMVPTPVIRHFLQDLEDGSVDGIPDSPFIVQKLENKALRKMLGMGPQHSGVLAVKVVPGTDAEGTVLPGDVLLAIDGLDVANDGTVEFRPKERTNAAVLFERHQLGESIRLRVLRGGEEREVSYTLATSLDDTGLVPNQRYDVMPSYFVYGGLVFTTLTLDYLFTWGEEWYRDAPNKLSAAFFNGTRKAPGEEFILLQRVLPAGVNEGYHDLENQRIVSVNGRPAGSLEELVRFVETAKEGPWMVFGGPEGERIVLNREQAEAENQQILEAYRVLADRSADFLLRGMEGENLAHAFPGNRPGKDQ